VPGPAIERVDCSVARGGDDQIVNRDRPSPEPDRLFGGRGKTHSPFQPAVGRVNEGDATGPAQPGKAAPPQQREPKAGPDLKGYGTRAWIAGFLHDPRAPGYMGRANIERGMKPAEVTPDELADLTELIYAETGARDVDRARVERARPLIAGKDCDSCHDLDGTTGNTGPNLKGYATLAYVVDVIADASEERLYGPKNQMPRFANVLTPDEIADLARFVLAEARR